MRRAGLSIPNSDFPAPSDSSRPSMIYTHTYTDTYTRMNSNPVSFLSFYLYTFFFYCRFLQCHFTSLTVTSTLHPSFLPHLLRNSATLYGFTSIITGVIIMTIVKFAAGSNLTTMGDVTAGKFQLFL